MYIIDIQVLRERKEDYTDNVSGSTELIELSRECSLLQLIPRMCGRITTEVGEVHREKKAWLSNEIIRKSSHLSYLPWNIRGISFFPYYSVNRQFQETVRRGTQCLFSICFFFIFISDMFKILQ